MLGLLANTDYSTGALYGAGSSSFSERIGPSIAKQKRFLFLCAAVAIFANFK